MTERIMENNGMPLMRALKSPIRYIGAEAAHLIYDYTASWLSRFSPLASAI